MAIRPVVMSNEPRLHEASQPVTINATYQSLVDDMIETMIDCHGVGIAAPQIGVYERLAIITQGKARTPIVIINPRFLNISTETDTDDEGCLSIPGVFGPVERAESVEIEYQDLSGKKQRLSATGFDARIIQHEIDHLAGTLFVDHIDDLTLLHR